MFGRARRSLSWLLDAVTNFKQIAAGLPVHFLRMFPEAVQFAGINRHQPRRVDARASLFKRPLNRPGNLGIVVIKQQELRGSEGLLNGQHVADLADIVEESLQGFTRLNH
ncbi:hypothetical protein D3C76_946310 [compost metagenome]